MGSPTVSGPPVTIRARKEGITVQEVVDRYHNLIKDSFEKFGISFDIYSRTTSSIHNKFASDFFRKLYDDGKLTEFKDDLVARYNDAKAKLEDQRIQDSPAPVVTPATASGASPLAH